MTSLSDGEEDSAHSRRQNNRRLRILLADYYGLGGQDNSQQGAQTADPKSLDSSAFQVEPYYQDLIKTKSLKELIHIDNVLAGEIKKLDGDMKTLVYENYNKFISATETIRKMKSNVEGMEGGMKELAETMEQITSSSERINDTLAVRRGKIEQLAGVHRLLQKVSCMVYILTWM